MISKTNILTISLMVGFMAVMVFFPDSVFAQVMGGGFETKMHGLTTKLITVVLPLVSVLGLVYAVIMALTGDGGAKGRIIMVIGCSIVGFLAPHIISWFQSAAGQ
jgi:type IV secretory pathway VirB2 component (pilin)